MCKPHLTRGNVDVMLLLEAISTTLAVLAEELTLLLPAERYRQRCPRRERVRSVLVGKADRTRDSLPRRQGTAINVHKQLQLRHSPGAPTALQARSEIKYNFREIRADQNNGQSRTKQWPKEEVPR
jgi:hypothetical protein